jgi:hypothetical protein
MFPYGYSTNTDRRHCPTRVIDRIRDMVSSGQSWSLDAAEIRELLGVNNEDFYRRIYAAEAGGHPLISLSAATGGYSQENIWEFVALIELFCGGETEARLEQAGIFFSHPEQLEILGIFLTEAAGAVRHHDVDSKEFSAMLRAFGSYERARDVYLEEYFPLTRLISRVAAVYCGGRSFGIPELAEANAERLLQFFFQKHVLEARSVFAVLIDQLLRQAVAEGYAAEQADTRRGGGQAGAGIPDRSSVLQKARRSMNLEGRALTLPLLKGQYKRLMKIYHPDINPRGLRRCQEITAAYSLLLSAP